MISLGDFSGRMSTYGVYFAESKSSVNQNDGGISHSHFFSESNIKLRIILYRKPQIQWFSGWGNNYVSFSKSEKARDQPAYQYGLKDWYREVGYERREQLWYSKGMKLAEYIGMHYMAFIRMRLLVRYGVLLLNIRCPTTVWDKYGRSRSYYSRLLWRLN